MVYVFQGIKSSINVRTLNSVNKDCIKANILHNYVFVCSIMDNSFQYWRICHIYLNDLEENNSIYVLSAEMSGLSFKTVRDPRSQVPPFRRSGYCVLTLDMAVRRVSFHPLLGLSFPLPGERKIIRFSFH